MDELNAVTCYGCGFTQTEAYGKVIGAYKSLYGTSNKTLLR